LLGELLELVGRLVDRLQVALMLVLASRRGDVGMPCLGHPAPRQLHGALIERGLELQQEQRLLYVEDPSHAVSTLATPAPVGGSRCPSDSRCRTLVQHARETPAEHLSAAIGGPPRAGSSTPTFTACASEASAEVDIRRRSFRPSEQRHRRRASRLP